MMIIIIIIVIIITGFLLIERLLVIKLYNTPIPFNILSETPLTIKYLVKTILIV